MLNYYAQRSNEYDEVYLKPERQTDLSALKARLPNLFKGKHVLELASGTGYWTQFISPVASEVVAVDAARETLVIAKNRVSSNVKFVQSDVYQLPFHNPQFNAAFAGFWFSHVPVRCQKVFLLSIGALLIPGSKVVLIDNLYVEGSSSSIVKTDGDGNTYQMRKLKDGTEHCVVKNFPTESALRYLVAGMAIDIRFVRQDYFWIFEYTTK